jgi:hypothetical protein
MRLALPATSVPLPVYVYTSYVTLPYAATDTVGLPVVVNVAQRNVRAFTPPIFETLAVVTLTAQSPRTP